MGVPGEPRTTVAASSVAQSAPGVVDSSDHSSNLSSLIDLDMGSSGVQASANGNMLTNDLQDLGKWVLSERKTYLFSINNVERPLSITVCSSLFVISD